MNLDLLSNPKISRRYPVAPDLDSTLEFTANSTKEQPSPERGLRLGHVHIKVRSLDRSIAFYGSMLNLRLTERAGRFAFLALGQEHHSIALEEIGSWTEQPSRRAVGVAHIAFDAADLETYHDMQQKLRQAMIPFISSNNGTSWTMQFKDPDGTEIQISLDRRQTPGGSKLWRGRWYGALSA
jgi:catechol 2,3-dioxygenase